MSRGMCQDVRQGMGQGMGHGMGEAMGEGACQRMGAPPGRVVTPRVGAG